MLDRHILTFNENIIGLRDFISLIGPFIEEHHEKAVKEHQLIVDAFEIAKKIEVEEDEIQKTELQNQLKSVFDGQVIKAIPLDKDKIKIEGEDNEDLPDFAIAVPVSLNPRIDQAMKAPRKTNYQKELLYKNAFIGLLSSVEWFYSQVLHFYYDKHPEAAGIKKKTMTLEDLKTFGTVQDAEKFLIDSKIEEVFRAGFDAWMDILKDEVKLKLPYVRPFFNELLEVYQRRNLLVHNGGIVNSIYISKVSSEISKDLKIGDKLTITSEYLENAICKLHIVFTLIAAELWKKLEPIEESRADILNSIAYRNMNQGRWEVSEWLSCFIKDDENLKSRVKTVGQLNFWLSRKKRGNRALVIGEVLKADFTDKSLRYQLAVSALTDNKEEFFELLPETLRTKSLEIEELLEFPIFDEMRNTSEFEEFKLTSEEFKAYKQIETNSKDDNEEETLDDVIDELIEEATTDRKEQE
jgi:predicted RNA-binding protein